MKARKAFRLTQVVFTLPLSLCVVLCLLACDPAWAVEFAGGTGDPNHPYQIATAEQLLAIGSNAKLLDKCFVLIADIDLDPNLPGGQVFARSLIAPYGPEPPVAPGKSSLKLPYGSFDGVFDGNGRVIRNLVIRAENEPAAGLFGYVGYTGRIENLGLERIDIQRSSVEELVFAAGSLAAVNQGGTVLRCYARGTVAGPERVRGPAAPSPKGRVRAEWHFHKQ